MTQCKEVFSTVPGPWESSISVSGSIICPHVRLFATSLELALAPPHSLRRESWKGQHLSEERALPGQRSEVRKTVWNLWTFSLWAQGHGEKAVATTPVLLPGKSHGRWSLVAAVHGVARNQTWLSDFTFHFHALEKEMATHSSILAWRIPGMGESGGLLSMGLHRVGHDWSDLAAARGRWGQE